MAEVRKDMNFNETNTIKKEQELLSQQKKKKNRIRLDMLMVNLSIVLGLLVVVIFCFHGAVRGMCDSSPEIGEKELLSEGYSSVIYDALGNKMQSLNGKNADQTLVSENQMSEAVKKAFLAAEDARFYEHHGIDVKGLLGEIYAKIKDRDGSVQESQTITQKLLKNQVLHNQTSKSLFAICSSQIQEKYLAIKLEDTLGKEKVLEYYLNTICMGENLLGVQAASQYYFNKDAIDLTVSEAALLAAVGMDSEKYDPLRQQKANAAQRSAVLENMLNLGFISEDEYEDALGEDVYNELQNIENKKERESEVKSCYADAVISNVIADLKEKAGYTQTQAYNAVYRSGLKIYTCQDRELQKICDEEVDQAVSDTGKFSPSQMSFVLIDQTTGMVRALTGENGEETMKIGHNLVLDQESNPGDALSLLSTWLPALDTGGMSLGTVQDDSAYRYQENGKNVPVNEDKRYRGLVTMRESILDSLRIPTVKTLESIMPQTGFDYLKNLGFSTLVEKAERIDGKEESDINLSLASGKLVKGVNNLELTSAYVAIANGGKYIKPVLYTKVVDRQGNILLENETEERKILKSTTTWLLTDVLSEFISQNGNEITLQKYNIGTAGISGNSSSGKEVWFEGYTPFYTAGIWCGYEKKSRTQKEQSQSIWNRIMLRVHEKEGVKDVDFKRVDNIVEYDICTKCGKLAMEGLCDEAQGGNCIQREYFARGTEPTEKCDCHIKYTICRQTGKLVNENCPESDVQTRVFLRKEETGDTDDTPYVLPGDLPEFHCDAHK